MAIPPPPPGFTVDQDSSIPPPPPGFTLDQEKHPYLQALGKTALVAASPIEGFNVWQGLKPETKRSMGYLAGTIVAPELVGAGAESVGVGLLAKTLMRGGAGAGASALSDVLSGHKVNKRNAGIMAGTEGVSGVLEAGANAVKPYIPAAAEKWAGIKAPVLETAAKYGNKFKTKFPGTTEAIEQGAGQVNKYFGKIADAMKNARERVYNVGSIKAASEESKYAADVANHEKTVQSMRDAYEQAKKTAISDRDKAFITAHEEALTKHAENIKGLASDLSDKSQTLDQAGKKLSKAARDRGINIDPVEELKNAKIGPRLQGTKHELALALPSRLPTEMEPLEVEFKQLLSNPKPSIVDTVRLKRAFQDVKYVQGKLGYSQEEAVNAYLNELDGMVKKIDPEYSSLEKTFAKAKDDYDKFYDKSKKIFESLKEGEDIGIPRDMLPKSSEFQPSEVSRPNYPLRPERPNIQTPKMIPPSGVEKMPYGKTPGSTKDVLYNIMHPGEGRAGISKELRQRVGRAPGAEQAMGNIAAKDLKTPIGGRGMLFPLAMMAGGIPAGIMSRMMGTKKSTAGFVGGSFAAAGLVRAALQSPVLYRSIVTNPELLKSIVTKVPWAAKLLVAGNQE